LKKILLASSIIVSLALGSTQDELMSMDRKIPLIGDGASDLNQQFVAP